MDSLKKLKEDLMIEDFDCLHFVDTQALKEQRRDPHRQGSASSTVVACDPQQLTAGFERSLAQLDELRAAMQSEQKQMLDRARVAEADCRDEVAKIYATFDEVRDHFDSLDRRITAVSHKVGHLGDQLESVNGPRERLAEMELLVRQMHDFCMEARTSVDLVSRSPKLAETAATIHKLYQICSEFPDSDEFLKTKQRIIEQYKKVENFLYKEFEAAFVGKDYSYCCKLSAILANFGAYSRCTDLFVAESLKSSLPYLDADVYRDLRQSVGRTMESARLIFASPETVFSEFVQAVFSKRLKELVANRLKQVEADDRTAYLKALETVHQENRRACDSLADLQLGVDLGKLSQSLFLPYLSGYFQIEKENLIERCQMVLDRYYEEQGHVRRKEVMQQQGSGPHNLLQHIIFSGVTEEQGAGRVLLCGLSVANIVAEVSQSCTRCRHLTHSAEFFQRAKELADVFFRFIYDEHVNYGLRLAALGLPQGDEAAQRPNLSFLEAVREANMIFHLCENKYSEILSPALKSAPGGASPQLAQVQERRRAICSGLESQIQQGLERAMAAIVAHTRHLLNTEQKATDFRPPGSADGMVNISGGASHACVQVCNYLSNHVVAKLSLLDGKNGLHFRDELGIRLYRCLVEHLHKFKYSLSGGLQALCDLTEYMACLKPIRLSGFVVEGHDLYDVLCKLLNLLVIQPANLHDICEEESLRPLSREVKQSFVTLRADSGTAEVKAALEKIQ